MPDDPSELPGRDQAKGRAFHPRIAAACALVALIVVIAFALVASSLHRDHPGSSALHPDGNGVIPLNPKPTGKLVGQPLPAAGIVGLDGSITDLTAATKGRPTVVNFFAESCTACITEMPALQALAASTGGKLRVVGIDVQDSLAITRSFLARTRVTYPVFRDPQALILSGFGVTTLPTTIAIDADGHIVGQQFGAFDAHALSPWVAKYLKIAA